MLDEFVLIVNGKPYPIQTIADTSLNKRSSNRTKTIKAKIRGVEAPAHLCLRTVQEVHESPSPLRGAGGLPVTRLVAEFQVLSQDFSPPEPCSGRAKPPSLPQPCRASSKRLHR
jgi:hypothetical protein